MLPSFQTLARLSQYVLLHGILMPEPEILEDKVSSGLFYVIHTVKRKFNSMSNSEENTRKYRRDASKMSGGPFKYRKLSVWI